MDKNNTILDMLLNRSKDSRYYHKVIEISETKYDIKTYKIGDLNADKLKSFFHTLASKYNFPLLIDIKVMK